jgi:hypothetical protein
MYVPTEGSAIEAIVFRFCPVEPTSKLGCPVIR